MEKQFENWDEELMEVLDIDEYDEDPAEISDIDQILAELETEAILADVELEEMPREEELEVLGVFEEYEEAEEPEELEITSDLDDQKTTRRRTERSILQYVHDLVYLLAAVMIIFVLLFRVVVVSGTSMNKTLLDGDYLLVLSNTLYKNPKYGDVIVASKDSYDNGVPIVKRVIATEGQVVDIDFQQGIVYVDGVALDEPYTLTPTTLKEGVEFPLTVDEGCVFVLGDNRDGSKDSRSPEIGLLDEREILGKVIFLFFPGDNGRTADGNPKGSRDFGRIGVVD